MSPRTKRQRASFALHDGPGTFLIPNPWDVGSARILAGLGFQALATSSAASASALGRTDGGLTRDEALLHARLIVEATDLPVSADLEKGFGDAPEVVAETIQLAAGVGHLHRRHGEFRRGSTGATAPHRTARSSPMAAADSSSMGHTSTPCRRITRSAPP